MLDIDRALLEAVRGIAREAGAAILSIYDEYARSGDIEVTRKADASPLTQADLAAHRIIVDALRKLTPQVPILSEEAADVSFAQRNAWRELWLVDPLDGTKEFLSCNGEFTVNIALVQGGRSVLGCVFVPVDGLEYYGARQQGAFRAASADDAGQSLRVAAVAGEPPRILVSRSHDSPGLQTFLDQFAGYELIPIGSSLKFCRLAEGEADLYPRLGPTSEWDTAAGQALVEAAGGRVLRLDGNSLSYNQRDSLLNPHFVAVGPQHAAWLDGLRRFGVS